MADTWGSAPYAAFHDELLDGATMEERGFFALVKVFSNDVDLFEGDAGAFARIVGGERADVERLMLALEQRGLIRRYQAPGRVRLVGLVLRTYDGDCHRKANPSQRTQSFLPFEDGTFFEGRAKGASPQEDSAQPPRKQRASNLQPPRKSDATSLQPPRKQRASDAQEAPNPGASLARDRTRAGVGDREEQSRAEQSSAFQAEHTAYVAPVSAPEQPALGGAGMGALEHQGNNGNGSNPAEPPKPPPDPPPTPAEQRCRDMRWTGTAGPEHSAALLAWSRECGVPERKLRQWLEERERPPNPDPSLSFAEARAAERAARRSPAAEAHA